MYPEALLLRLPDHVPGAGAAAVPESNQGIRIAGHLTIPDRSGRGSPFLPFSGKYLQRIPAYPGVLLPQGIGSPGSSAASIGATPLHAEIACFG